jgi:hypothetical protein
MTVTTETARWEMTGLYPEDAAGGMWGDQAVGEGYIGAYRRGDEYVDISYYVEEVETDNLPEVRTAYVVSGQTHYWKAEIDGEPYAEEYDYFDPSVMYYDTYDQAAEVCRRHAWQDETDKLNW